jgi:DNA-directed RNA polymerase specialized sigma24 family protein
LEPLNYEKIVLEHKGLVESMAYIALTKMHKPSPHSFDDLCQEGYIVCVEWVRRWFHPERGASLKTFITAGLRNRFADMVRASFRENVEPVWTGSSDEDGAVAEPVIDLRNTDHDPIEMASFNETVSFLSEKELRYITTLLTPKENHKMPTRVDVRKALGLSEDAELKIRYSVEEKLTAQIKKF